MICLLLFVTVSSLRVPAQDLDISFEEVTVIGDEEPESDAYLFGWIRDVETDTEGRIYVATEKKEIRVFDLAGRHITTFGRSGRGPGEFREITSLAMASDGSIMATDRMQFRATRFSAMGDDPQVHNFDFAAVNMQGLVSLNNGSWAITYDAFEYDREEHTKVVQVYSSDFSTRIGIYFDIYEFLLDPNDAFEQEIYWALDYHIEHVGGNLLALSCGLYDGNIYIIDTTADSNAVTAFAGGFADGRDRYHILSRPNDDDSIRDYMEKGIPGLAGGSHGYIYQKRKQSVELFHNSKWLVNYVVISDDDESRDYFEFFTPEGTYLGRARIDDKITVMEDRRRTFIPRHIDENDRLYYIDLNSGYPVLRVVRMTVSGM